MKFIITISYDGSKYHGLQKLKGKKTVQGELEKVLTKMNEKPVFVKASGRTDRGVHAYEQICHFEIQKPTNPYKLRYYINNATSPALYVKNCTYAPEDFHARFSVKSKTYLYKINFGEYDAIQNDYLYNFNRELDIDSMKEVAQIFLGEHDFKAFVTGKKENYYSDIKFIDFSIKENILEIQICGKAFYTYMVRNIIQILILVGTHKITKNLVLEMLSTGKRLIEYGPAPACGLYLLHVEYSQMHRINA